MAGPGGLRAVPIGAAASGRHVALVPGADAPLLTLDLPAGLRGAAREDVARRQIRDRLGPAGDGVEMRPFPPGAPDWSRAVIAARTDLARWRAAAGPGCRAVLPDYLALPVAPGLWSLGAPVSGDALRVRLGEADGFAAEPELAALMLSRALEAGAPRAVYAPDPLPETLPGALAEVLAGAGVPVVRDAGGLAALGLPAPVWPEAAVDLRDDPRAARAALARQVLPWRWPLLIGALAAALWAGVQVSQTRDLRAAEAEARAGILADLRAGPIPEGPILDIRAQLSRALEAQAEAGAARAEGAAPLALLKRAALVIVERGAVPERMVLAQEGALVLDVTLFLPDFAAAEALQAALEAAGLGLAVQAADTAPGGGVRLALRLTEGAR